MPQLAYTLTLASAGPLRASALFPSTHPAFADHFPDNPILPAFMHIQLALDTLRLASLPHQLQLISSAKFLHPISPNTPISLTLALTNQANTYEVTLLLANGTTASVFTLDVA